MFNLSNTFTKSDTLEHYKQQELESDLGLSALEYLIESNEKELETIERRIKSLMIKLKLDKYDQNGIIAVNDRKGFRVRKQEY